MKNMLIAMVLCLVFSGFPGIAGAYLAPWGMPGFEMVSVEDPSDPGNARDILKAWHGTDGLSHYFRLDLAAAPAPGGENTEIYGIYIDAVPGEGSYGTYTYVPEHEGIDYAVDSHYDAHLPQGAGFERHDFHAWDNTGNTMLTVRELGEAGDFSLSNNGRTLEWRIDAADIGKGGEFTWFAATHDYIEGRLQLTSDETLVVSSAPAPPAVPVPRSGILFFTALICLTGLKRNGLDS